MATKIDLTVTTGQDQLDFWPGVFDVIITDGALSVHDVNGVAVLYAPGEWKRVDRAQPVISDNRFESRGSIAL